MVLPDEVARAADDGDVDVVRAFLAQHPERVDDVNDGDRTLLQLASLPIGEERERRSLELVQLLVTAGANVDRRHNPEHEGPTELHNACILSCPGLLQALVRAGADVTLVTRGPMGSFPACQPISIVFGGDWRAFAKMRGITEDAQLRCMYECTIHLLRGGHPLDFLHKGSLTSLEALIEPIARGYDNLIEDPVLANLARVAGLSDGVPGDAPYLNDALELARAVRAALSTSTSTRLTQWQKYCLVPPKELLRLRSQIARGKVVATRATPPHLARLFSRSLPNEIAWRVLAFWNPRY